MDHKSTSSRLIIPNRVKNQSCNLQAYTTCIKYKYHVPIYSLCKIKKKYTWYLMEFNNKKNNVKCTKNNTNGLKRNKKMN